MSKPKVPRFKVLVCGPQIAQDKTLHQQLANKFELSATVDQKKALETIAKKRIDLVILKIMKEDLEFLQSLRSQFPSVTIVVITEGESKEVIAKAFHYGARDVFTKPLNIDLLVERIEGLLRSKARREGV